MPDLIDFRIEFLRRQAEKARSDRAAREIALNRYASLSQTARDVLSLGDGGSNG